MCVTRTFGAHGRVVARPDLLNELPQQRWNAGDVDQAEQGMVGRTRHLFPTDRTNRVSRVLTGMEQPICDYR